MTDESLHFDYMEERNKLLKNNYEHIMKLAIKQFPADPGEQFIFILCYLTKLSSALISCYVDNVAEMTLSEKKLNFDRMSNQMNKMIKEVGLLTQEENIDLIQIH